jgi:hypothetical protein
MEMFLMVLSLSVAGVLVSGALFAVATRDQRDAPVFGAVAARDEDRFFMMRPTAPPRPIAADALVLQIERHVRLEHAAAEAFLQFPTVEALRMRTLSPLAQ